MPIDTHSIQYKEMSKKWQLPLALLGGTATMREAAKTYLPQEPKESDKAYEVRKNRTFLFNMFRRTIQSLSGQALIKSVVVNNVPAALEGMEWNFDGTGRSITDVAHDLFHDLLVFGIAHAYPDLPEIGENEVRNYAEYIESGITPFVVRVSPTSLIGWRESYESGFPVLENIRIYSESIEEGDDEWEDKVVKRIQVMRKDTIEHWVLDEDSEDSEWALERTTDNPLGYVPLYTAYAAKTGFMTAEPPLEDLAWLNLRHWQSSSDQNNILHVARVPFIFAKGFAEGELGNTEIGINRMIVASNENADMKHVEHTGAAINSGRQDLRDIEQQMAALGADLVLNKSVARQTATAREIDRSESLSVIQIALRNLETLLENLYRTAGQYIGVDATEVSVTIGADLNLIKDPNPTDALIKLKEFGLSEEVILAEAQRRGLLAEYVKLADIDLDVYHASDDEDNNDMPVEDEEESEADGDDTV